MNDALRVVNAEELVWTERDRGDPIKRRPLGAAAGARMLGCSMYELPPDSTSWPMHYHCANEEAVYVLEGEGALRTRTGEEALGPGDFVAFPKGESGAHQIINRSAAPLVYLCLSTMIEPDVSVYPESRKVGIFAGSAPGGSEAARTMTRFLDFDAQVDYWEDE